MKSSNKINVIIPCVKCKKEYAYEITKEQYFELNDNKKCAQDILTDMKPEDVEMFISGVCGECWNKIFSFAERRGGDIGN